MTIQQLSAERGIESILHFTTNRGSLGLFASRALKSRQRLNADQQLKHIFQPNARYRDKDRAWLDYANLSVSQINTAFFRTCSGSWHREKDFFWCILDFTPEILLHDDVWFTTTNNIYTNVERARALKGWKPYSRPPYISTKQITHIVPPIIREISRRATKPRSCTPRSCRQTICNVSTCVATMTVTS